MCRWAYGYAHHNQQRHVNATEWSGANNGHAMGNQWSCPLPRAGNRLREQLNWRAGLGFVPHIVRKGHSEEPPLPGGPE
uniref:Uncharacterized protein n=1 Tax=Amphimedon queenslandica TaxID=400682 RepID=A0A1X7SJ00_AMPQE